MIQDPIVLTAVIAAITALAFWLERRFAWGRNIGASLLIIFFGALLSNFELMPAASPVYSVIGGPLTSLAIVWLLLGVNLKDLRQAGPRMLGAFFLAVTATAVGALVAALSFGEALGGDTWKLAGVMTGTYAGGSLNFVAVAREVGLAEAIFTASTAADNVLTALWMGATLALPIWLRRFYPERVVNEPSTVQEGHEASDWLQAVPIRPFDVLALLTLGLGLVAGAGWIAARTPVIPSVVWLTSLALLAAQVPAVRALRGAFILGLICLNLFFAVIGIGSKVAEIFRVGPEVFLFTLTVVLLHGLLVYGGSWLLGWDVESASVASQAAVGGPSTAMALAVSRGWRDLALPGVLVGLLGYAVGNYAGLAMAALVRSF